MKTKPTFSKTRIKKNVRRARRELKLNIAAMAKLEAERAAKPHFDSSNELDLYYDRKSLIKYRIHYWIDTLIDSEKELILREGKAYLEKFSEEI